MIIIFALDATEHDAYDVSLIHTTAVSDKANLFSNVQQKHKTLNLSAYNV